MKLLSTSYYLACSIFLSMAVTQNSLAADKTHYPGIFLGSTTFESESDFTFGLEYEYRLNKKWGLGGAVERINEAHHGDGATVWTLMGFYHPVEHWKIGVGLGQERLGGSHPHNEDLIRVALAYEYPIGKIEIAPTIDADILDGDVAVVVGLAFIYPF